MTRGRKPIAVFGSNTRHINEIATTATNLGAYTVESLAPGLYYFLDDEHVVLATGNGYMKMHISTARVIADELPGIWQTMMRVREMAGSRWTPGLYRGC